MNPVPSDIGALSLLIVEDDAAAREALSRILGRAYPGLTIRTAQNGAVGLELYRRFRPELVMTDVKMPALNGIEMTRSIKKIDPEAIVIAVTAHSDTAHLLGAIEVGIHHYLIKPVAYPEMVRVVNKAVERIALQRQVEEQLKRLRRSEQQLSEAQKITHLGSWEWDMTSGQMVWSDEFYRILGLKPDSVPPGYPEFLALIHPGDREMLDRVLQHAFARLQPVRSHYFRIVRPDGSLRRVCGKLEVLKDAGGRPISMIGTCHDVSEQKLVETALRASEQKFLKIFQATPDLLSLTCLTEGTYLEVNDAFLQALGYRRSEVLGRPEPALGIWADPQERQEMLDRLQGCGKLRDIEVRFRAKSGAELVGLVSLEPIELSDRRVLLTLFKDISERKRFEEDRARLAAIVESSDDAIMAADASGTVTCWNAAAERIFGYSCREAIGRHLCFLAPPEQMEEMCRLHDSIRHDEQVIPFEMEQIRKDGTKIHVSLTMSPIRGPGGMVVGTSCIARDVTERVAMEELIRHQAQHDSLTGLPNRRLFMDFLELALADSRRNRKHLAVFFLDLDHFKQINDTLGHAAGDLLLQSVAQRLKECVRDSDTVARLGGDEFNILVSDLGQRVDVATVLDKVMAVFAAPFLLGDLEVRASTSVGISMFPEDGDSCEELVQKADSAMYVAKRSPGSSHQFYNGELNRLALERRRTEHLLRSALDRGELKLMFQPQLQLESGRIVGAEALLRWQHPENGLLLPAQFLGVAEESGVIVPIGAWVIRTACAQVKSWQQMGYPLTLTVNLSPRQFHQPDLLEMTARSLDAAGLEPQSLELDITESAIMENLDFSRHHLRRLAQLGVSCSIDDFGVGSSSLHWLKQLPIAKVKIDRSFIRGVLTEPDDLAVVSAVICMSHNFNMKVNAVGVEFQEQLNLMRNCGCDEVQGDLISKPLEPWEFEKLVANM